MERCSLARLAPLLLICAPAALAASNARIPLAQMAVEDANARGPVFDDKRIRLEPLDDQHNPTQAVLVANKLIANPDVLGVVGHFNSSCSKAASAI